MRLANLPVVLTLAAALAAASIAFAAAPPAPGRVQGKVIAADTGEPLAAADVLLIPADSTRRRVGGFTNSDGTFLLEAPPGAYTLQVRAISYRTKRIADVTLAAGEMLPVTVSIETEAIRQQEVVVEARLRQDSEKALLLQRQRAATVGDAVSSEMVRRSPDRDAAEVLRRVTGLSVQENKFVYVRGMGERYSSTEVDGVRLVSPEANKRVVPLDLVPAGFLDHVVVQKTYTADRPGEFGGGDVKVRTRDFPGERSWSLTLSTGATEGATFQRLPSYASGNRDWIGLGSRSRDLPGLVEQIADHAKIDLRQRRGGLGFSADTMATLGRAFRNVWSPARAAIPPNTGLQQTYGDEWKLLGRPLAVIQSLSYGRSLGFKKEHRILPGADPGEARADYGFEYTTETVQLGAMSALSYRLTPFHSFHVRGLMSRDAEDEVRTYGGFNADVGTQFRGDRLLYRDRLMASGVLEGKHEIRAIGGTKLNWKLSGSRAERSEPDRRESVYMREELYDEDSGETTQRWRLRPGTLGARREFEEQKDRGHGFDLDLELPAKTLRGKLQLGGSVHAKDRDVFRRRLAFIPNAFNGEAEDLFADPAWNPGPGQASIQEWTFDDDNYAARQDLSAGYASVDAGWRALRAVLGVRVEHGIQDVRNFDYYDPSRTTAAGRNDDVDWLPSANLTWRWSERMNVRLAASRTLSRPDLRELSPAKSIEQQDEYRYQGNPELVRARIDNYDVRWECFPAPSEVIAAGVFYKRLHDPIEKTLRPADEPFFQPFNSARGRNAGVELELRTRLERVWKRLDRLTLAGNLTLIDSEVELPAQGFAYIPAGEHPLAGQASYLFNGSLGWTSPGGSAEASVLVNAVGRRLDTVAPGGDYYYQPETTLDAAVSWKAIPRWRLKLNGRNLLDTESVRTWGKDAGSRRILTSSTGRGVSVSLGYGS